MENPGNKEESVVTIYSSSQDLYLAERMLHAGTLMMKYISLVTLTLQNASLNLLMRIVRTQQHLFLSSTAVLMAEIMKLLISLMIVGFVEERSLRKFLVALKTCIIKQPLDTIKVSIPSMVYLVQNNLLYIGATHLDAATCQVTYQLKILTTALFSVVMLNKRLNMYQWISLGILFLGVALVQLAQFNSETSSESNHEQKPLVGFLAIVMACCMSGFAGVYFEKILKGSDITVWMRNIQLCITSIPMGLFSIFFMDWADVSSKGFFYGYNYLVWTVIFLQATGGIIVAAVVKYADNILKGFSTSLAIVLSCIFSVYMFKFQLTSKFVLGASLVIGSVFLYSRPQTNLHKK